MDLVTEAARSTLCAHIAQRVTVQSSGRLRGLLIASAALFAFSIWGLLFGAYLEVALMFVPFVWCLVAAVRQWRRLRVTSEALALAISPLVPTVNQGELDDVLRAATPSLVSTGVRDEIEAAHLVAQTAVLRFGPTPTNCGTGHRPGCSHRRDQASVRVWTDYVNTWHRPIGAVPATPEDLTPEDLT
jgi:hypothetical protein